MAFFGNAGGRPAQVPNVNGPTSVLGVSLKPNESSFYERMYLLADPGRTGAVTGLAARSLFSHTTLTKPVLSKIWETADRQKRKVLDREDFFIALRLISLAQSNLPVALQSIKQYTELQLPYFDNIPADGPAVTATPVAPANTAPGGASTSSSIYGSLPDILPQTKSKKPNSAASHASQPPATVVPAAAAAPSGPLSHVQTLGVPVLPSGPVQSHTPTAVSPAAGGGGVSGFPAVNPLSGVGAPGGALDWSMSEEELVQYSSMFTQADGDQDGFVSGKEALQFFQQSGLDRGVLRKIWILADVDKDGKLNHDEFAVAMHLVFKARKKWALPDKLPDVLIKAAKGLSKDANDFFGSSQPSKNAAATFDIFSSTPSSASAAAANDASAASDFGFSSDPFASKAALSDKASLGPLALAPGGPTATGLPPLSTPLPNSGRQTHSRNSSLSKLLSLGSDAMPGGGDNNPLSGNFGLSGVGGFQTPSPASATHPQPVSLSAASSGALFGSPVSPLDPSALANALNAAQQANIVRQESMLRSALDAANSELGRVSESAKDATKLAEPATAKLAELEEQLTKAREKIATYQDEIRQSTSKMAEAQRRIPEMKIEAREAEAQISVLETNLTTLRSQLKDVERLRSGLEQIVATRRETLARLVAEKNEVSELLEQSKIDLSKLRTQDQLLRDAAETAIESAKMLKEQLNDSKALAEAVRKNPPKPLPPPAPASGVLASPFLQADPKGEAAVHARRVSLGRSSSFGSAAEAPKPAATKPAPASLASSASATSSSSIALPTPVPSSAAAPPAPPSGRGGMLDDDDAFKVDDLPDFTAHASASLHQRKKSSSAEGHPRTASQGSEAGESGEAKHEKKGEPEAKSAVANHFGESFPADGLPPLSAPSSSSSSATSTDDFGSTSFDDPFGQSESFDSAADAANAAFDSSDPFGSSSSFDDPWGETKKEELAPAVAAPPAPVAAVTPSKKTGDPALDFLGITINAPKPKPAPQSSPASAPQPQPQLQSSSSPAPGAATAPTQPPATDLGSAAAVNTLAPPVAVGSPHSPASSSAASSFDEMNGFDDVFDPFAETNHNATSPTGASVASSSSSSSAPAAAASAPGASASSVADDPFSAPDFPEDPFSAGNDPFAATNLPAAATATAAPVVSGGSGGKDWADFDASW